FRFLRLFSLTLPLPPSSSLFPYTTLFRSRKRGQFLDIVRHLAVVFPGDVDGGGMQAQCSARIPQSPPSPDRLTGRHAGEIRRRRDRKSTRLNSSHVSISYAVFCLKKKTVI